MTYSTIFCLFFLYSLCVCAYAFMCICVSLELTKCFSQTIRILIMSCIIRIFFTVIHSLLFEKHYGEEGYHINYGSFDLAVIHDMLYIIMRDSHKSKRLESLSMSFGELSICDFLNDELAVNISQFVSIFSCEKLYLRL